MLRPARTALLLLVAAAGCAASRPSAATPPATSPARAETFESGWRFLKEDAAGAEVAGFDDAKWRRVDVPHDWSIEGPFSRDNKTGGAGGWLPSGVAWYRKHFSLPAADANKRVFVDFDGVMANSDVWINGHLLGHRPYGYSSFRYELTDHLRAGDNVLAVRTDTSEQPASRWYSGAGIYRHVRLVSTNAVHFDHWANFVATPRIAKDSATIRVNTVVVNQSDAPQQVTVTATIHGPPGSAPDGGYACTNTSPEQLVPPGGSVPVTLDVAMPWAPRLWNLDHPDLHQARIFIRKGDEKLDEEIVPFGIRSFEFKPDAGFWLNGRNFKLKGVCLHHDGGAFGAAVPLGMWEQRLRTLQTLGVNAIRTAHNPPAPEFLDLCDRLGLLVMDETFDCWTVGKNRYDYHLYFRDWFETDARDMVRRDRNHPSVILYSAGNEIHDTPHPEIAKPILARMVQIFHENDPTRPVTQALFRPNVSHDYDNGLADLLDVVGQNYREKEILAAHAQQPSRRIVGTENQHGLDVWLALRDHPEYAGQFLWTGIDYLGESRRWPTIGSNSGLLDRTGFIKPMGYQRQSWWSDQPMVFMCRRIAPPSTAPTDPGYEAGAAAFSPVRRPQVLFADWTPRGPSDRAPHEEDVEVYSNAASVELFLNDKSLGSKTRPADDASRNWRVSFEPGTVRAVARNEMGDVVATHELRTARNPARLRLRADPSEVAHSPDDVARVEATVVDEQGVTVPSAADEITFTITGMGADGVVAATDNGDNATHESFQSPQRHAYQGRCVAFIKATGGAGAITVKATAAGLTPATVTLQVSPPVGDRARR